MRAWVIGLTALLSVGVGFAGTGGKKQEDNRVPYRLAIHHADPWAVKAMLEGVAIDSPELSTVGKLRGQGGGQGGANRQAGNSPLLKDGFLVVNPTDNSLWWYPKKD